MAKVLWSAGCSMQSILLFMSECPREHKQKKHNKQKKNILESVPKHRVSNRKVSMTMCPRKHNLNGIVSQNTHFINQVVPGNAYLGVQETQFLIQGVQKHTDFNQGCPET